MKLKKAMREYARAVDAVAAATVELATLYESDSMYSQHKEQYDAMLSWLGEARKEKKRAVRQMHAVMSAMQYRGKDKMWTPPQVREITSLRVPGDIVNAAARAVLMGCSNETLLRYQKGQSSFVFDETITRRVERFRYEDANGLRSNHKYVNGYD